MPANTILDTIGNTPHIRIQRLFGPAASVWIKQARPSQCLMRAVARGHKPLRSSALRKSPGG